MSDTNNIVLTNTAAGFTRDALAEWISRKIGGLVWRLEAFDTNNEVRQAIEDGTTKYSEQIPMFGYMALNISQRTAILPPDAMGVLHVFFTDGSTFFTQTAYDMNKNLTGISSMQMAGGRVGEYADFLQWRKMFQRILSQRPTYTFDEMSNTLLIDNPMGYRPCVYYTAIRPFEKVRIQHRTWIRDWALADAKERLGTVRRKFGGSIQGPGGTTITMDSKELLDEAKSEKEALDKKLNAIRPRLPIAFD